MMSRTLFVRDIHPLRDDVTGALKCRVGNSVIVFEVMCDGRHQSLRVYIRPHRNLRAIYGDNYYPQELLVSSTDTVSGLADVVLCEWHEGETLQNVIEQSCKSRAKMRSLSLLFEEFALSLLNESWAHGDFKPENIIVGNDGLHLIDFDAMYYRGFTSDDCVEIGTRQYQHPKRDTSIFDKSIDDFTIEAIAAGREYSDHRMNQCVAVNIYGTSLFGELKSIIIFMMLAYIAAMLYAVSKKFPKA